MGEGGTGYGKQAGGKMKQPEVWLWRDGLARKRLISLRGRRMEFEAIAAPLQNNVNRESLLARDMPKGGILETTGVGGVVWSADRACLRVVDARQAGRGVLHNS